MYKNTRICYALFMLFFAVSFLSGCKSEAGGKNHSDEQRVTATEYLVPSASGTVAYEGNGIIIDASNTSEGYVMVKYTGSADKVKLQITVPDSTVYSYNLRPGDFETFPLSAGDGNYQIAVLEHACDDLYAIAFSQDIEVTISDEFKPFLYPNQYVWYTPDSEAVAFGAEISDKSSNDLDYVEQVYRYVIENITYDDALAANVQADYLPVIDNTLKEGKGICFDYASLMAAMFRSQNIPTKLVVGYSGDAYHAWISVYLKETGWVNDIIKFDGKSWALMDPTLAANNSNSSVKEYIGDGSNYTVKYSY